MEGEEEEERRERGRATFSSVVRSLISSVILFQE